MPYTANERRYEAMQYARCGKSGLKLPRVSLGLWHNFGSCDAFDNMRAMLRAAFDCGITHIDMANNYGPVPGAAEENFGRIFEKDLRPYRDELVLSSKAGYTMWPGPYGDFGSRKYLLASLDQSLKRTGLEYFDIFYSHRMDPETPLEETMGALASAVQQGKALYAGISNYDGETTARAAAILKELHCPFIINQSRYSIFDRTIEKKRAEGVCRGPWCGCHRFQPAGAGTADGQISARRARRQPHQKKRCFLKESALTPERLAQIAALNELAAARGQTLAQMALSWVLKDSGVTSVLIGASRPQQIVENAAIVNAAPFTQQELDEIERIAAVR